MGDYERNHYVPEWYQYRFLGSISKEKKFYYLDMKPEMKTASNGKKYSRKSIFRWGPRSCFFKNHLYTTRFSGLESTEIEEKFFGKIDIDGKKAVEYFSEYNHKIIDNKAFHNFLLYLSVQKIRTPKGLSYLASISKTKNKNDLLFKMQDVKMMHCALWTECVWSIVDASESKTKFIVSDNPVTVYNSGCFPASKWCRRSSDPEIWLNGTQTIFPLCIDKALILTNLSWVRNPYASPLKERPHSQLFRTAMFKYTDIQTGRVLSETDVLTINYIIKNRAKRYIAAAKQEWLYPEKILKRPRWDKIGSSYLLMPDPRSVPFTTGMFFGFDDDRKGGAFDEYGRKPWHDDYQEKIRQEYEWITCQAFKGEYARLFGPKRRGVAYEFSDIDRTVDSEEFHKSHLDSEHIYKQKMQAIKRVRK